MERSTVQPMLFNSVDTSSENNTTFDDFLNSSIPQMSTEIRKKKRESMEEQPDSFDLNLKKFKNSVKKPRQNITFKAFDIDEVKEESVVTSSKTKSRKSCLK